MALHDTRGALALAGADDVDQLACLEETVDRELLTKRIVSSIRSADLGDVAARRDAGSLEVGRKGGWLTLRGSICPAAI
ncbi:hypothetical protein QFZ46_000702 [Microbacterium murale]|uniref:Uncharacterized protein n=1 Tax=Microbacterium murale TaxID=1081040 RepID=A0ABU0P5E5_9MICO|nr:hypothetical protein [Microbacterium murale]